MRALVDDEDQPTAPSPVLLGVRHHGPGSARAVRRVLSAYQPDVILIEGPPEADGLVSLAGDEEMCAPVALLAYPADPKTAEDRRLRAAFWPFGEFSPEWQALRWAVAREVPVHFIDLPTTVRVAVGDPPRSRHDTGVRADPIGSLAAAAGYDDPERWWEDVVEHRFEAAHPTDELAAALAPFQAIAEAMTEVRAHAPAPPEAEHVDEERREAAMRTGLRGALRTYQRVAVVCGAWHVPALAAPLPPAAADARTLRGLPKVKVAMTWVPWTHARLASWQGYGAGVRSPGWYHHLFTAPDEAVTRWLVRAAGVLRRDGVPVSSAHVIEASRLAEALATMRGRPVPGLSEVTDAARAVLCEGDELRLELIQRRLVVGERLGRVPDNTPGVPIARDVAASQRRLRLPPEPLPRDLDLDLRRDIDLERSRLLHRLGLLGVDWGTSLPARSGRGTFWESWRLGWQPEFAVDLVEASAYGTTVRAAATARVAEQAARAGSLADVTALVERCLLAELPDALPAVLAALDERVALDADVSHLMDALPALARTLRYGDVRGTDVAALRHVAAGLITRICVGLPAAVGGLDDNAAAAMRDRIDAVHLAIALLDDPDATGAWLGVLAALSTRDDLHGLLSGRLNRLLLDAGRLDVAEAGRRMGLVLTVGVPVARAAAWIEGFLTGDGLLLVHDERLLRLVDGWLTSIPADAFVEVLPLLRRTFSEYPPPQRRQIGERAVRLGDRDATPHTGTAETDIDVDRGELVMPTVAALLGWGAPR
ncbi:MAG TPA: DUF5682 family protein [Micromonosporaceae bacterium]|nr:DUF5682 family protein [Micromonosporaceae bacterium]